MTDPTGNSYRLRGRGPAAYVVSAEVADGLHAELAILRQRKEREIAERLRDARGFGDGADNDELMAIREEEAVLDARIASLEELLHRTRIADGDNLSSGTIALGSIATVEDLGTRKTERYSIVGMHERLKPGEVSAASPIGQALLGRRAGERITVDLPDGRIRRFEILASTSPGGAGEA